MDIIASNWKAIGVNLKVIEHDPAKYYADQDAGKRAYLPINEWTWGRQENGIFWRNPLFLLRLSLSLQ